LIKSNDYPIPMENIHVEAFVNSKKGSLRIWMSKSYR
jgi:AsmA protein